MRCGDSLKEEDVVKSELTRLDWKRKVLVVSGAIYVVLLTLQFLIHNLIVGIVLGIDIAVLLTCAGMCTFERSDL